MSFAEDFRAFMTRSKTPYNFCAIAKEELLRAGFVEMVEGSFPSPLPDRAFFVRDGKSLLAFDIGGLSSCVIAAAHCDSPMMKVKPGAEGNEQLVRVANYAGGLSYAFCGRDVTVAGALFVKKETGDVEIRVVDLGEPVAITGMKWATGDTFSYNINRDTDLNASLGCAENFVAMVASRAGVDRSAVVDYDLALVDSSEAIVFADFITSARLDNLSSSYPCLKAFLASKATGTLNMCAVFDAEEIGSRTRAGALSDMIEYTLEMICKDRGADVDVLKANGLFVSADAAHASHPNFPDMGAKLNTTRAGEGVIIKETYKGSYAYDERAFSLMIEAARRAGAKHKWVGMKNGRRGGGTIGPKVEANIQMPSVDIGPAAWAMHSHREMMAWRDVEAEQILLTYLYNNFAELHKWAYGC